MLRHFRIFMTLESHNSAEQRTGSVDASDSKHDVARLRKDVGVSVSQLIDDEEAGYDNGDDEDTYHGRYPRSLSWLPSETDDK